MSEITPSTDIETVAREIARRTVDNISCATQIPFPEEDGIYETAVLNVEAALSTLRMLAAERARADALRLERDETVTDLVDSLDDTRTRAEKAEAEVERLKGELHRIKRTAEMSVGIMSDPERTGGWKGSERVADQFHRIADRARTALQDTQEPKP